MFDDQNEIDEMVAAAFVVMESMMDYMLTDECELIQKMAKVRAKIKESLIEEGFSSEEAERAAATHNFNNK